MRKSTSHTQTSKILSSFETQGLYYIEIDIKELSIHSLSYFRSFLNINCYFRNDP